MKSIKSLWLNNNEIDNVLFYLFFSRFSEKLGSFLLTVTIMLNGIGFYTGTRGETTQGKQSRHIHIFAWQRGRPVGNGRWLTALTSLTLERLPWKPDLLHDAESLAAGKLDLSWLCTWNDLFQSTPNRFVRNSRTMHRVVRIFWAFCSSPKNILLFKWWNSILIFWG